uniref:Uncharacterized protein n=1 Tax=Arundo donax TaxID=35708 RepID=A0A0A9E676_ARUDO
MIFNTNESQMPVHIGSKCQILGCPTTSRPMTELYAKCSLNSLQESTTSLQLQSSVHSDQCYSLQSSGGSYSLQSSHVKAIILA